MAERKLPLSQKELKARKRAKNKKPDFARSESWRYVKLKENWRRPRGLDHKMRRKIKGWPPTVSVGYKGPKTARGLHPSGYKEVLVYNANDISHIDPKTEAARIAHTVGKRKRVQIIAEAKKMEVFILNFKPAKESIEEEEEKPEEAEEELAEKPEESSDKESQPKRGLVGRQKVSQKGQKSPVNKEEKPQRAREKAKTRKGAE